MRTDLPQTYLDAAASERHHLRLVVEIAFDASNRLYFTSHSDIKNIPGTVVYNSVKGLSATTQKLNMIAGRAEIGEMNFELVDKNRYVTDLLRAQSNAGRGVNGCTVRLYKARKVGVTPPDFLTDFGVFGTQEIAKDLKCDGGRYKVQCQDVQRNLKPEIFNPAKTRLAANFMKGASTLTVYQTADFEFCPHGPSFTDTPGTLAAPVKVIYGVIESDAGKEIVRATAKTATTFTITGRGLFGTRELDHVIDGSPGADNGPEFTEFPYLELPAPKFAYALATGRLLGQGGADPTLYTLPSRWHLGIAESLMVTADFDNTDGHITDWYNPADDSGLVLRVDGAEKTEGKTWLETQVLLPMGAFMPVNSKGQLGLRRMTRILSDAATIGRLDERSITKVDDISYNLAEIFNRYELNWSYLNLTDKPKYWRTTEVKDQPSITKWKKEQLKTLSFQTLHASRHTESVTRACIDWLRDMYAGPPITSKLGLLPSYDTIEVGDVFGVSTAHIPDHLGTGSLNRSMMVIGCSVDQDTGKVSADMFGSTFAATPLADLLSGNAHELPDSWYNSVGTALTSLPGVVISGGVMTSPPSAGINGGSDINAANSIFYYLGDLTIPSSVLASITGNVWLRVRGHFQVEGEINGVGGGMAAGQPGFIGPTESGGKLRVDWRPSIEVDSFTGTKVTGKVAALPAFGLENAGGVIKGMPKDMRGTGSANAGNMYDDASATGGLGVKGGAALCITSRGGGLGAAGKINLSGQQGNAGGIVNFQNNPNWQFQASSSGGGAPGCLLWQLDGALSTVPILPGRFIADFGALNYGTGFVPAHRQKNFRPIGANLQWHDYGRVFKYHSYNPGKGGEQVGLSACRIVFIPPSKTPYPDYVPPQLDAAILAAQAAAGDATAAQADATAALSALTDIGADGKLAPAEKKVTIREYNDVINEQTGIGLRADGYGITTEKTTYNNAITALTSYLVGLSPAWNSTTSTTTITRTTWNSKWNAVYTSRQALLNKIAEEAGERATWATVTGTGRPEDNATLGANLATNVTNRFTTHLQRNNGDSTSVETIIQRIGNTGQAANQRFLNAVNVGSIRSRWDGLSLSYTSTTTTGTITASAGTLRMGSQSVNYNSANVAVSKGAGASTQTFQLYYLDDAFAGGSRTLNATTDANSLATADGVVWVGQVVVTFQSSGGGGGEPGGGCVDAVMWVDVDRQAFDVPLNDHLDCPVFTEPPTLERRRVRQNGSSVQPCHRIVTESGAAVVASDSTPMTLRDGSTVLLPDMLGREALVHDLAHRALRWERVIACYPCGHRPVIKFNVGDTCLMAGESPLLRISTHNVRAKP